MESLSSVCENAEMKSSNIAGGRWREGREEQLLEIKYLSFTSQF